MKKAFLILAIPFSVYCFSQPITIQWKKCLGGFSDDRAESIIQTLDGGYIAACTSSSNDGDVTQQYGQGDIWIVKLFANGSIDWQKSFGGSTDDHAQSIIQVTDGGYIIIGFTRSSNIDVVGSHGDSECWVIKLNATGIMEWQKPIGGSERDFGFKVKQTSDNGYIIAGATYSNDGNITTTNHGQSDFWVIKLAANGNIQWQNTFGGSGADTAYSVDLTTDGGYILCGSTSSNDGDVTGHHGSEDAWIIKLNSLGGLSWQKAIGGSSSDRLYDIKNTSDGGYIAVGSTSSINGDLALDDHQGKQWSVKLDANGVIQWQKTYGGSGQDNALSVIETTTGGYIIAGSTNSSDGDVTGLHINDNYSDSWIVKLSTNGALQWQKTLGGMEIEIGTDIKQTSDGGYIFSGGASSIDGDVTGLHGIGNLDAWVVKLEPELSTPDFIKNSITIYPNPVSEILQFQMDESITINKIIITDVSGKILIEKSGNRTSIDVQNLSSGTYILQAYSEGKQFQNKFIKE
ncbi:MAG: T9SS type A sorting domain-containing protein [Bacteroidota bacterium]